MIRMLSRSCRPVVAFVVCSLVPAGVYAQSAPGTSPTVPSAVPQVVDTIHACVGLVMGLVTAGISDCPGDDPGGSCAGFRAFTLVMVPAVYTTFGIGVDALVPGRTTLYRSPANHSGPRPFRGRNAVPELGDLGRVAAAGGGVH